MSLTNLIKMLLNKGGEKVADYIITNGQLHSTDELKHWKYIKKVRKNGKWRYYYDVEDAMGVDEREAYEKVRLANDFNLAKSNYLHNEAASKATYDSDGVSRTYSGESLKLLGESVEYQNKYRAGLEKVNTYRKAYEATPLGKLEKIADTIRKGLNAINSLFEKFK